MPGVSTLPCPTSRMQGGFAAKFVDSFKLLPYAFVGNIRVTNVVAGTAVQFSQQSVPCDFFYASGETNNGGVCFIGDNSVRGTLDNERGLPVVAGANNPVPVYINDLSLFWMDATVTGDEVLIVYFRY